MAIDASVSAARSASIGHEHRVAFVAHRAEHRESARAGEVGERARAVGGDAAPRDADVHVDEHLADAVARGCVDRCLGIDRDGDARAAIGERAQAVVVDRLVREEEIRR